MPKVRCASCDTYVDKTTANKVGIQNYCSECSPKPSLTPRKSLVLGKGKAPRKAPPKPKKRKPDIPPEVRASVLDADGYRCRFCGTTNALHLHHVVYRSSGGKHVQDNLLTLCVRCHEKVHSNKKLYQPLCLGVIWLREIGGDKLTLISRLEKE